MNDEHFEDIIHQVGKVIWETSRRDEGTISVMGASIVSKALYDAGLLRKEHGEPALSRETKTSKNYMPTTEQVCGAYVCDAQPTERTDEELRYEFYGWLDRVVSEGWIEGYKAKEYDDNQGPM